MKKLTQFVVLTLSWAAASQAATITFTPVSVVGEIGGVGGFGFSFVNDGSGYAVLNQTTFDQPARRRRLLHGSPRPAKQPVSGCPQRNIPTKLQRQRPSRRRRIRFRQRCNPRYNGHGNADSRLRRFIPSAPLLPLSTPSPTTSQASSVRISNHHRILSGP